MLDSLRDLPDLEALEVGVLARSEQNNVDAALDDMLGVDGGEENDDEPGAPKFDDAGIEP